MAISKNQKEKPKMEPATTKVGTTSLFKNNRHLSKSQLVLFIVAFGLIGLLIYKSFAAVPLVASAEAERMSVSAPAAQTGFSTSISNGMSLSTPYLWTFDPGVPTTAGYFWSDGKLLKKVNGPGPYVLRLNSGMLSSGTHNLGHAWDIATGQHKLPSSSYKVSVSNVAGSGFVTTMRSGGTLTTPYLWAFDPGVNTAAGYFWADGKLLQKVSGSAPYILKLSPTILSAGSHQFGHAWDTTSGAHQTPPTSYTNTVSNSSTAAGYSLISDSSASGGQAMKFGAGTVLSSAVSLPGIVSSITVVAHGEQCSGGGWPQMQVLVDGTKLISSTVSAAAWTSYSANVNLSASAHTLTITNASSGSCLPNLYADVTNFYGPVTITPSPTVSLSVSPTSVASGQAATLTWTSTNATACNASGAWSGSKALSGTVSTGALNQNSTYGLTCTGGGGSALASASVSVNAVPPPTSSASCTRTLSATDSIINAYNAAHGGDVICLAPGAVYNVTEIDFHNSIGTASAPITITSADVSRPSTILGRIVTFPGANYLSLTHLKLDGKCPLTNCIGPTIGSGHITLQHDDITNENTAICVHLISDSTYGTAQYTLIDQNRIHNCGRLPAGSTNNDHGIYDIGYYNTITNNFIYDNSDRGIQLRGAHGDTVRNNVSDGNGEGIIFGELGASNNNVYNNIFSNSIVRYNIESYWGGSTPGAGNSLHDSCVWTTRTGTYAQNSSIQPGISGVTLTNIKFANPQYNNQSAKDFTLAAGSPCAGYGIQSGARPGI
jgi:hypothetical protein